MPALGFELPVNPTGSPQGGQQNRSEKLAHPSTHNNNNDSSEVLECPFSTEP